MPPKDFTPWTTFGSQPSVKSVFSIEEQKDPADIAGANWWWDAKISFNLVWRKYY